MLLLVSVLRLLMNWATTQNLKKKGRLIAAWDLSSIVMSFHPKARTLLKLMRINFAAELLMPEHWIRHWHESGIGFKVMQKTLNVSEAALKNRFDTLRLV